LHTTLFQFRHIPAHLCSRQHPTQAQSNQSKQGVKLSLKGSSSSGRIVGNADTGTRIDTTSQYATEIGADFYATTAVKMIDEVSAAFIGKLQ